MTEPENLVLALLRDMRSEMTDMRENMATKDDLSEVRSEMRSLRADVASDLMALEKRLSEQIVGLRRAVMEYHSSAIGHGVLISEFEERLRRVEQHLNLPPVEAH
jgi:hypothetical protein